MEYEQMTLEGFALRAEAMERDLAEIKERLVAIEAHLDNQEKMTRRTNHYQQLQTEQIEKLTEIVRALATEAPLRPGSGGIIISKEEAYRRFEACGIGKVTAMRALRKTGVIQQDTEGRNTRAVWIDGTCKRAIVVTEEELEGIK